MKVTIDRSSWSNGDTFPRVRKLGNGLRTQQNTQCCLGFVCEQAMGERIPTPHSSQRIISYPNELMKHPHFKTLSDKIPQVLFDEVFGEDKNWLDAFIKQTFEDSESKLSDNFLNIFLQNIHYQSRWENVIAYINDDRDSVDWPEGLREKLLSGIFEKIGIQIEYVGTRPTED